MTNVAILVNSFDGYAAAWPAMAHGLEKYWEKRPWPLFWMSNHLDPPIGYSLKCGDNTNWSDMMIVALGKLREYGYLNLMFLHEDYWLVEEPDTLAIEQFARYLASVAHIQICPSWDVMRSQGEYWDSRLMLVANNSDYRASNQASLWRISAYQALLRPGESAWDFEVDGSKRCDNTYGCLCVKEHEYFKYVYRHLPDWDLEPIVKGKWTDDARKYCEREGVEVDFTRLR